MRSFHLKACDTKHIEEEIKRLLGKDSEELLFTTIDIREQWQKLIIVIPECENEIQEKLTALLISAGEGKEMPFGYESYKDKNGIRTFR